VVQTRHPDATAFAARFLAHPDDRLGRLVFADWLEEQVGESKTAWAQYLRLMAQAEEEFDGGHVRQATAVGRAVRARLTLGKVPGTPVLSKLTAFLPAHRVWLRIGPDRIPRAVTDNCQGYLARLYRFMPIGMTETNLLVVAADEPLVTVLPDVENFLCCRVTAFRGDRADVNRALVAHYGREPACTTAGLLD
jgi:uncharacterized protein (TIGR02996 family)